MKFNIILITISSILFSSCFKDVNNDPTRTNDAGVAQILPGLEAQSARNLGAIGARVTGCVIQQYVGLNNQPAGYSTYEIDEVTLNEFWRTGLYGGAMKDCADMMVKVKKINAPYYAGISKLLMAFNLGLATSCWGDVPYAKAFEGEANLTPAYDAQSVVYDSIQSLLDQSIDDFKKPTGTINPTADDLIFKGDAKKWLETARALKARYYMHLSKRDLNAASKVISILTQGTILSNAAQPNFPFENTTNGANPIASFGVQRPGQLALGKPLVDLLVQKSDPRLSRYTRLVSGNYVVYSATAPIMFWAQNNSPLPLISFAEVKFLLAEAYLRSGDEPKALLELSNAIKASMESVGLLPVDYTAYLNTNGNFTGLSTFTQKLNRIMEQKYIAMYAQGTFEAWVDYRRTGTPLLVPPTGAQTSFNPSKVIPRRYLYPISERIANGTNMNAAIQIQNGHLMDVNTWSLK